MRRVISRTKTDKVLAGRVRNDADIADESRFWGHALKCVRRCERRRPEWCGVRGREERLPLCGGMARDAATMQGNRVRVPDSGPVRDRHSAFPLHPGTQGPRRCQCPAPGVMGVVDGGKGNVARSFGYPTLQSVRRSQPSSDGKMTDARPGRSRGALGAKGTSWRKPLSNGPVRFVAASLHLKGNVACVLEQGTATRGRKRSWEQVGEPTLVAPLRPGQRRERTERARPSQSIDTATKVKSMTKPPRKPDRAGLTAGETAMFPGGWRPRRDRFDSGGGH